MRLADISRNEDTGGVGHSVGHASRHHLAAQHAYESHNRSGDGYRPSYSTGVGGGPASSSPTRCWSTSRCSTTAADGTAPSACSHRSSTRGSTPPRPREPSNPTPPNPGHINRLPWSWPGRPADEFGLVVAVHGLGQGVVVGVADAADRRDRADLGEPFAVAQRRELRPGVAVTPSPSRRVPRDQRAISSASRTMSVRMCAATRQPDDHPGEGVDDEAHVGHAGPGRHVGQVGDPQLVRRRRRGIALDQVRVPGRDRIRAGGADPLGPPGALDARRRA